jgi:hypothetical protein
VSGSSAFGNCNELKKSSGIVVTNHLKQEYKKLLKCHMYQIYDREWMCFNMNSSFENTMSEIHCGWQSILLIQQHSVMRSLNWKC